MRKHPKKKLKIYQRKRFFSLIEMVIAFALLEVLIFFLFGGFTSLSKANVYLQRCQKEMLAHARFHLKLNQVFESLDESGKGLHYFFTDFYQASKEPALFFSFHSIDSDPKFSSDLQATLFLDLKSNLKLVYKSSEDHQREEILLENVKKLDFEFFDKEEKGWSGSWGKKRNALPLMMRLKIGTPDLEDPFIFVFNLEKDLNPICYKK